MQNIQNKGQPQLFFYLIYILITMGSRIHKIRLKTNWVIQTYIIIVIDTNLEDVEIERLE